MIISKLIKVSRYGEKEFERLMNDPGIIRNRLKINAAIENAKIILKIREETGSFRNWLDIALQNKLLRLKSGQNYLKKPLNSLEEKLLMNFL